MKWLKLAWFTAKLAWYWLDDFVACLSSLDRRESWSSRRKQINWERNREILVRNQINDIKSRL